MWSLFRRKARPAVAPARRPSPPPRLETLEERFLLNAGGLDTTFNPGGSPPGTVSLGNKTSANAVLVQPSGETVLAGVAVNSKGTQVFATDFLKPDGTLDTTKSSGGVVLTDFKGPRTGSSGGALAAALYPTGVSGSDDKIIEVGGGISNGQNAIAVVRYNPDGSLDSSFGNGGVVLTTFSQKTSGAAGVVVQSDGKIVVAAQDASSTGFELVRYNADGSLDTTFGSGGKVYTPIGAAGSPVYQEALALDPASGDFLVAGEKGSGGQSQWVIAAYTQKGALDTTFGNGGTVYNPAFSYAKSVAVQSDGSFVVAGWGPGPSSSSTQETFDLARYTVHGALDATFGNGGDVTTAIAPGGSDAWAVAIQPDGKIVAAGGTWDIPQQVALVRYNTDGSLDTTFGSGGVVTTAIGSNSRAQALALLPNGEIVAAGYAGGGANMAVARYLGQPQIGSFTSSSGSVTAGDSVTVTAAGIADGNPGSTITQVAFYVDSNKDGKLEATGSSADQLLGYGTFNASTGQWTFTWSTTGLTAGTYKLFAQAEDSYGALSDPLSVSLTVA